MVYSIYAAEDATLYERYYQQNTSKDAIIEIMRYAPSSSYDAYNSRALYKFNITEISQSISSGLIPTGSKYFLSLKCTEAYQLPLEYTIDAFAVSSSWESGIGKFADDPITTAGVSWKYKDSLSDATLWISGSGNWAPDVTGSYAMTAGGGDWYVNYKASQSFNDSSADINMDVTDIFNAWINDTIPNNGLIIKWHETSYGVENLISSLKFFSIDSHTIFLPKVDIKWDDHIYVTQSYSYSVLSYSGSRRSQNFLGYPALPVPPITNTFTYTTSSAVFLLNYENIAELTSSYINYTNIGDIKMVGNSRTCLITGSYDGYLSGSFQNTTLTGSGSGYIAHNSTIEYLPELTPISINNNSGSYVGYYSGSITSKIYGSMSGSFSGSLVEYMTSYNYFISPGNLDMTGDFIITGSFDGGFSGSYSAESFSGSFLGTGSFDGYTSASLSGSGLFDGYLSGSLNNEIVSSSLLGTGSFIGFSSGSIRFTGSLDGQYNSTSLIPYSLFNGTISGSFKTEVLGHLSGSFDGAVTWVSSSFTNSAVYKKLYYSKLVENTYNSITGSQTIYATSSVILPILTENKELVVYPTNLNSFYKQTDKAIIQINSRPRYPDKIYTTGSMYKINYRLPESSYYSIKDASSEESIIDFDTTYTKLSCGNQYEGNYFKLWFNAFQPERNYRILIKTVRGDVEEIFDNKFIFKVVR
jgi:hypothetical protein